MTNDHYFLSPYHMENKSISYESILAEIGLGGAALSENYSIEDFMEVALEYQKVDHWFLPQQELALIISFIIVMMSGSVANLALLWIICRRGFAQSNRNWYILNLAISDIFTIVMCQPFVVFRIIFKNWTFGLAWCKIATSLQSTCVFVSTLSILALAVDRYKSVLYTSTKTNNPKRACLTICGIWFLSFTLSLPLLLAHQIEEIQGVVKKVVLFTICTESWTYQSLLTIYTVMVLLIQYVSPATAIVTLHILICHSLKFRIDSRCACEQDLRRIRKKLLRHRKNVILLTSMAVWFAVSWLPLTLLNILADTKRNIFAHTNFPLIHAICLLLSFMSVCVNPVIYGWFNSNFRKDIKDLCELSRCHLFALLCHQNTNQIENNVLSYSAVPISHVSRDTTRV